VSQKSLNDEERGGNRLLVPERSYGPGVSSFSACWLLRKYCEHLSCFYVKLQSSFFFVRPKPSGVVPTGIKLR